MRRKCAGGGGESGQDAHDRNPESPLLRCYKDENIGEMSEWSKVYAWKAYVLERAPRVQIPLSPSLKEERDLKRSAGPRKSESSGGVEAQDAPKGT